MQTPTKEDDSQQRYAYKWYIRKMPYLLSLTALLLGGAVIAWISYNAPILPPSSDRTLALYVMLLIWVSFSIVPLIGAKRATLETSDIFVSEKTIQGPILLKSKSGSRKWIVGGYAMRPAIVISRVGWDEIRKVEQIRPPALELMSAYASRGLRLTVPDGKILIFSNIQEYEQLSAFISQKWVR